MALSFDGGNILTILLMLAVFYIHKYFDKNNRAIDLVRKTAEDAKKMLDNLIKERYENLQDLSRDIMARTETCTSILQGIDDTYESVNEKKNEIENQMTQLDKFEEGLIKLNDMAARVDENLQRLQEESRYVDGVDNRLGEIRRTMVKLDEKDEERFEKFQQKALGMFKSELESINNIITESNEQAVLVHSKLTKFNSQEDEAAVSRLEKYGMGIEKLENNFKKRLKKIVEEGGRLEDEAFTSLKDMLARREDQLLSNLDKLNDKIVDSNQKIQDEISNTTLRLEAADNRCVEMEERISMVYSEHEQSLMEMENRLKSASDDAEKSIRKYETQMEKLAINMDKSLKAMHTRMQTELTVLNKLMEESKQKSDDMIVAGNMDMDKIQKELNSRMENMLLEVKSTLENLGKDINKQMGQFVEHHKQRIQDENNNLSNALDELRNRMETIVHNEENRFLEGVEIRQNDYKDAVGERFERIEGLMGDMDGLVDSLKLSQAQTLNEIEKVFKNFDDKMKMQREQEETVQLQALAQIRQETVNLEQEISALKTKSYENTSQRLQVFEDEFFSDLTTRNDKMQASIEEWKGKIESELQEIGIHAINSRKEIEQLYSVRLKEKIDGLQNDMTNQHEIIQKQISSFNDYSGKKVNELEGMITSISQNLPALIQKEKENSKTLIDNVFNTFKNEIEEELDNGKSNISRKFTVVANEVNENKHNLLSTVQQLQDDIIEKVEQINKKMSEMERDSESVIKNVRLDFDIKTSELKEVYAGHTERLILETEEERVKLHRDIEEVRDSVDNISLEITEKSRVSLNKINDQCEKYLLEFQKVSREIREEIDRKTKDIRLFIQESTITAEDLRKEMVKQVEHEHGRLKNNLDEIDRKQKQFISETRIFDRADELKENLASDINKLDKRLKAVGISRDEIARIEQQYSNSLDTYREMSGKMTRMLADKQKIDNLKDKMTQIGNLSETIDAKLIRLNESGDKLQDFQIRMVNLEDVHKALGEKFNRMYEQSTIMDKVSTKVDSTVQIMVDIDTKSKELSGRLDNMSKILADYNDRQIQLEKNKDKIDEIVSKAASLDESIAELNERLEFLQNAREWLAETETRLKELNFNTQQQLKLLGRVTRSERLSGRKNVDDNLDDREMIIGLAQNGWNSDAIAHSTKKSISEINLILELESLRGESD